MARSAAAEEQWDPSGPIGYGYGCDVPPRKGEKESILGLLRSESAGRLETRLRGMLDDYCDTLRGADEMRLRRGWLVEPRTAFDEERFRFCAFFGQIGVSAST